MPQIGALGLDTNVGEYLLKTLRGGSHQGLRSFAYGKLKNRIVKFSREDGRKGRIASFGLGMNDGKRLTVINVDAPTAELSEQ